MSSLTTPAAQPTGPVDPANPVSPATPAGPAALANPAALAAQAGPAGGAPHLRTTASGVAVLGYAAAVYVLFLCVLGYAVGFFAGLGVPKGIDDGPRVPLPVAVGVDLLLLLLFAVQHTVMARPGFKRRWVRIIPAPAERATFVLAALVALALLFWAWRPIDATVWTLSGPAAAVLWATYAAGWALTIASTFLISHSDLVGLRQAWHHARRTRYDEPPFTERGLYRRVRHPLMLGFLVVFWSAPTMTAGHLLFAVGATGYILVGIAFEERALTRSMGSTYTSYRDRVPALVPRVPRLPRSRSPHCRMAPGCWRRPRAATAAPPDGGLRG